MQATASGGALNATLFFQHIRTAPFGGKMDQAQVDGTNTLLAEWAHDGDGDVQKLAYVLATAFHETWRTMQPIEEVGHGRGRPYGVPAGPWHQIYDGRGDVQLTWEANYRHATQQLHAKGLFLNVDLEETPALAEQPDIAAAVMVLGMLDGWFTGKKLADYIRPGSCDYFGARRIINGTDMAGTIELYARNFEAAVRLATP